MIYIFICMYNSFFGGFQLLFWIQTKLVQIQINLTLLESDPGLDQNKKGILVFVTMIFGL